MQARIREQSRWILDLNVINVEIEAITRKKDIARYNRLCDLVAAKKAIEKTLSIRR